MTKVQDKSNKNLSI